MRARVQRNDIREQPVSISDVGSLVLYDDNDYALFVFFKDIGGLVHYASAEDDDFYETYLLATGGEAPKQVVRFTDLNLKKP